MADILKISTPLVDKQPVQPNRPVADPSLPFNLSDVSRVVQTNNATELMQQHTGMVPNEDAPKILADLLKDPSVTVGLIKNIYMLQEIINLLPANNNPFTQEIQQLFDALLVAPDDIAGELQRQELTTTLFKGDLFDQLRTLLAQHPDKPDIATGIGVLLKGLNATITRRDALDSVSNNLLFLAENLGNNNEFLQGQSISRLLRSALFQYNLLDNNALATGEGPPDQPLPLLADEVLPETVAKAPIEGEETAPQNSVSPNAEKTTGQETAVKEAAEDVQKQETPVKNQLTADSIIHALYQSGVNAPKLSEIMSQGTLTEKLDLLIRLLRAPEAPANYSALKHEVLHILRDVENSVLFTPQMEKVLPLIIYNLSRYNDNDDFLPDALRLLLANMDGDEARTQLVKSLEVYIEKFMPPEGARRARAQEEDSRVMDVLAKIIGRQAEDSDLQLLSGDKIEKIIHSLLSSPCNFTPLLHFIVPVEYMDLKAFAEIWIDPNAEDAEDTARGGGMANTIHMLMVFDVDGIGRFESELYVQDQRIALNLLCPPAYVDAFKNIGSSIRKAVSQLGYAFEAINIDRLERTHSLMDVFTDLPHKRTGIDVRV